MKQLYILFLFTCSLVYAQIPANYYDSANGLSGFALKTELKNIVSNGHIARTYDQLYDGNGITGSNGYEDTHSDLNVTGGTNYENDGTILDFYSENPIGADPYNYTHDIINQCGNQTAEGDCYNREHLVPQSSFNSAFPMQSDIHHVIPTDGRVNNFRGSLPFGIVDISDPDLWTSLNGSKRGNSDVSGYSGDMFEPIDEFKGDIARALLYFAVRYEDTVDGYTSFDMFNGTNDEVFFTWAIDLLLDWHNNVDPVDQREIDRNNEAYNFQGNANPFVDHPEYASMIWNPSPDTEAPTAPTNLMAANPTTSTIDLSWTASTDNVAVTAYDIYIGGSFSESVAGTSTTITGLALNTEYCFTVFARDEAMNTSASSNQDCATTLDSSGGTNDLFFSEYVEGSGTNKALEIANFTGSSVNLSDYTLKLGSNGNPFGTTYSFPNTIIANGDVFIVANSGLDSSCQPQQDDVNNTITSFNGNDAIGLFNNDVLIDIIGIEGDSSDFAENVTLQRKQSVEFPTTTYNSAEWNILPINDCSGLGSHSQVLNIETFESTPIKIYPNPLSGNILKVRSNFNLNFEVFSILGKKVSEGKVLNSQINISDLKKGIYLIKFTSGSQSKTYKLVRL
ncbi:endonuclease [Winogradskyella alexanderae]|uniref:Endonuclease n=1 Tax=Winogradskyella alexanderae TaxID=2877123 RepID=A0ABS7XQC0_9FLAO|nr:endonuclease [Winogradskyella alexanderae]MCA0132205.1 endonuclease [Winogradskyella alexanderae]